MSLLPPDDKLVAILRDTLDAHGLVVCRRADTEQAIDDEFLQSLLILMGLRVAIAASEHEQQLRASEVAA